MQQLHMFRDVAARNCLLDDAYHVKISDFGMANEGVKMQETNLSKVHEVITLKEII